MRRKLRTCIVVLMVCQGAVLILCLYKTYESGREGLDTHFSPYTKHKHLGGQHEDRLSNLERGSKYSSVHDANSKVVIGSAQRHRGFNPRNATRAAPLGRSLGSKILKFRSEQGGNGPARTSSESLEGHVPAWQRRLSATRKADSYILAELLQVRIYAEDQAKWTIRELKQWMHFLFLAGVEHIYVCDHYKYEHERLDEPLRRYIAAGLVTYISWESIRDPFAAQLKCYQYIIDNFKNKTYWQMAIDMDEYPYSPVDFREGFLVRYLEYVHLEVSEISLHNFLMLGQGDRRKDMVVDRITRMTPHPANTLVKPIYRPGRVEAMVHRNIIRSGRTFDASEEELKLLHYWGARLQDWGPDTPQTKRDTVEMPGMRSHWGRLIRASLLAFQEFDAFSNFTGP